MEKVLSTFGGRKTLSTIRIASPVSRGVTSSCFASGNVLLRMLMFIAFVNWVDCSLADKWKNLGVFDLQRLISYRLLLLETSK